MAQFIFINLADMARKEQVHTQSEAKDEDWDAEIFGDSIDRQEIVGFLQKQFHSTVTFLNVKIFNEQECDEKYDEFRKFRSSSTGTRFASLRKIHNYCQVSFNSNYFFDF